MRDKRNKLFNSLGPRFYWCMVKEIGFEANSMNGVFYSEPEKEFYFKRNKKNLLSSLRERHSSKWWRQCFCIHFTSSSWKYIFRLWSRNSKIFYFTQTHLVNNHFARPPCLDSAKINKIKIKQEYLETFSLFTLYVFIVYLSEVREGAEDVMNRIWTKTDRTDTSWSYIQNRGDAFNRKFHKNKNEYHHQLFKWIFNPDNKFVI